MKEDVHEFADHSLQRFPVWKLGNLNETQTIQAANLLHTTPENYKLAFANSLALRPLPSIMIYLEWCEQTLTQLLFDLFHKLTKFSVKINHRWEDVNFNSKIYWKPEKHFGAITIYGDKSYLQLLKNYFAELADLSHNILTESILLLTSVNPQQVIHALEQSPLLELKSSTPFIIEKLLSEVKQHHLSYLNQFNHLKISEILTLAIKQGLQLPELGEQGGQIILRLINAWLTHKEGVLKQDSDNKDEKKFDSSIAGNYRELIQLVEKFSTTRWGKENKTTLHLAVEEKSLEAIEYLYKNQGISVLARDLTKNTPLHYACIAGDITLVKYFIEKNSNTLFLRNSSMQSPWYLAGLNNHWPVIEYLSSAIINKNIRKISKTRLQIYLFQEAQTDQYKRSILQLLFYCSVKINEHFLNIFYQTLKIFQPAINLKNIEGDDMLHFAVKNNYKFLIKPLILAKADVNSRNVDNQTTLHIATREGDLNLVKTLCEAKASVSMQDKDGNTSLHLSLLGESVMSTFVFAILRIYDKNNAFSSVKNQNNLSAEEICEKIEGKLDPKLNKLTEEEKDSELAISVLRFFAVFYREHDNNNSKILSMVWKGMIASKRQIHIKTPSLILLRLIICRPRLSKRQFHKQLIHNGFFKIQPDSKLLQAHSYHMASISEINKKQYYCTLIKKSFP